MNQVRNRTHQVFFERIIFGIDSPSNSAESGTTCFQMASPFSLIVPSTVGVIRIG